MQVNVAIRWQEIQRHHPKNEVARLRQQLMEERRRGESTDAELAQRYGMTERTLYYMAKRYANAERPEDYQDRSHAPKEPHRTYAEEDVRLLREIRAEDEARIREKQEAFQRDLKASGKRLAPPKLKRVLNDMKKARPGYRRVARVFAQRTGKPMGLSTAQEVLATPP